MTIEAEPPLEGYVNPSTVLPVEDADFARRQDITNLGYTQLARELVPFEGDLTPDKLEEVIGILLENLGSIDDPRYRQAIIRRYGLDGDDVMKFAAIGASLDAEGMGRTFWARGMKQLRSPQKRNPLRKALGIGEITDNLSDDEAA